MPKQKEEIYETPNLYRSIGFVLERLQTMIVFVPWKAKDDFNEKYYDAVGRLPHDDEQGLIIHPEGVNKYWTECRVIFRATERETLSLFLGYSWIVKGSDDNHWNINNNQFFFRLLSLGFRLGTKQDKNYIKANIPLKFATSFEEGIVRAKQV